jgi:hypothetical protein
MAEQGSGPSGQDTAQQDGGSGPVADGKSSGDTSSSDRTSGGKSSGDRTSDDGAPSKDAGASQFKVAQLDQGDRGGRRPRGDDPLGGLFADIKDGDLRHVYVKPDDDYQRACRALRDRRVVVLQGKPGSGRHAMARHLLLHGLRLHDVKLERIEVIPYTTDLWKLKPFQRRSGYILERCPPERARRLRADELRSAAATLDEWEGYLVVTVDDGVTVLEGEDREQMGVVACTRVPDLKRVLKRHLKFYLRGHGGLLEEDRAWLDGDAVRIHLARHPGLWETVSLARELAGKMAKDQMPGRSERLNDRLDFEEIPVPPDTPEQRARGLLEDSWDVEHWSHVIAVAVFHGGGSQFVADAAGLLAKRLAPADPRGDAAWQAGPARGRGSRTDGADQPLRRMALIVPDHVPEWRPGPTRTDWLEKAGAERFEAFEQAVLFNRSPTLHVRFKDWSLRAAVLDHVWNELDELRGPVRDWLDELGDDPNGEVREKTAEAVGYLASHGLGYVLQRIIVPWMERGGRAREAAALALGVLGRDDTRFTGPVLAQLSQWARWGDEARRETAALAYGLAIGQDKPEVALRELRALAMREGTELPVAKALYELFRRARHGEVLAALSDWTSRPERATWRPAEQRLLRTGLYAFLQATRVYDESPRWPFLVTLAEEGGDLREQILVLWRRALADDALGELADGMLCGWAREADIQAAATEGQQPDLVGALARLVTGVAAHGPGDCGRVRQALNRCATAEDDPSAVARQLVDQLG